MKKELRRKVAKNKQEILKTGGVVPEVTPLANYEEIIYNLVMLSVDGLPPRYDDDGIFSQKPNDSLSECQMFEEDRDEETIYIELNNEIEPTDVDSWIESETPRETPKRRKMTDFGSDCDVTWKKVNHIMDESMPSTNKKEINLLKNKENMGYSEASSTVDFSKWNPKALQKPVSKQLNVKKRNLLTKLEAAEKVKMLSEEKKELVQVQINYFNKEIEFVDKEHELKLLKLKHELKCAELDVQIKEMDKKIKEETLKKMTSTNLFSI